ncbi:DUF2975 domain-containing protein [Shewanella sp. VB17]|uniref:DUF2975 domain-containing protein n=1 Tax=Shewanella sp. VB17 TaxID=2739432 RepID=UPI001566C611|nr:DUF2975 domain-containing protein [Shewanella sp. VB17]NRD75816.1 DUF2975 domain-containing protein [Shewanella sp. VB17]
MNPNIQKLMNISGFFRIFVLIATAIMVVYLGYNYLIEDQIRFSTSHLFLELWNDERANKEILLAIRTPLFITLLIGVYWLQKLLGYYQQGHFFGSESMSCYLWLIWIKVFDFVIEIIQQLVTGYYHQTFFEHTNIELTIDFGKITTVLLMLIIAYLLKAAKEIEAENKEFI